MGCSFIIKCIDINSLEKYTEGLSASYQATMTITAVQHHC